MKIAILSRFLFDQFLASKKVTPENVEQQNEIFFISINNQDDKIPPYFPEDKDNVKVMTFGDVDRDTVIPLINDNPQETDVVKTELVKAFSPAQAKELFQFIK